jgi:hypothetical protein
MRVLARHRYTNRRHMIGDHHHRTAARATLLATAADEILGTHRICGSPEGRFLRATRPRATRPGNYSMNPQVSGYCRIRSGIRPNWESARAPSGHVYAHNASTGALAWSAATVADLARKLPSGFEHADAQCHITLLVHWKISEDRSDRLLD